MVECNSHQTPNTYPNLSPPLSDQEEFRLNKINEVKDYFAAEIKERELMSKRPSKCIGSLLLFLTILISH